MMAKKESLNLLTQWDSYMEPGVDWQSFPKKMNSYV